MTDETDYPPKHGTTMRCWQIKMVDTNAAFPGASIVVDAQMIGPFERELANFYAKKVFKALRELPEWGSGP